jgi:hydrogenase expression/formation protein HypD
MNRYIEAALDYRGRPLTLMEVCGTHTMAIARYGLRQILPPDIRLISGPGCPVCVTAAADIDGVLRLLTDRPELILTTFGDLMRVPGSDRRTLEQLRAAGADVRVVYSVTAALALARQQPDRPVAFLAVGFETTAPGTAAALSEALSTNVDNFSIIALHKLVPPALHTLVAEPGDRIDGFLLPGHVCVVTGLAPYEFLPAEHRIGGVVTGFEPGDILTGIGMLVEQSQAEAPALANQYRRAVATDGNPAARAVLAEVFEPITALWRGLGEIPDSGLAPRPAYAGHVLTLPTTSGVTADPSATDACRCGDILRGRLAPAACPLFGKACTPRAPIGPCMVSSEGACAAAYRYQGVSA